MREPTYFLLLALTEGPLHGYAIAQQAEAFSGGRVRITAGTLYGALDRLVGTGQICVDSEEVVRGRKRRYYRITEPGRHELVLETNRMRATVSVADGLIGPPVAGAGA